MDDGANYTAGQVTWQNGPTPHTGQFDYGTAYTATVTLTAKNQFQFEAPATGAINGEAATVTGSGASVTLSYTFPPTAVALIEASPTSLGFGSAAAGYAAAPAAQTVTISNAGTQPVTLNQPTATDYMVGTLSKSALTPGETATFTVEPKPGLAAGAHDETLTVTGTDGVKAEVALSFTVDPRQSGGYGNDRSPTEEAIKKVNEAKDGDTVKLDLPANGKLPGAVLEAAAGKDITLEIDAGNGVTWIIKGRDIPKGKLADLDLKVDPKANTIPVTVLNALTGEKKVMQLELRHNGPFPFPLTLRLEVGKESAGLFANLYFYDETDRSMDFRTAAWINAKGEADIPFAHASSYAVVLDRESHAPAALPFTDVKGPDWFYEAVVYVYGAGLMSGVSDGAFDPEGAVTRAQLWTVLARMDGADITGGSPWYAPAQAWAVERGVSDGGDPNEAVTREQLVTMLHRYAQIVGRDVSAGQDANILSYADALDVAEWAVPAFQWACGAGIVSGTGDAALSPRAGATRAQLAAILQRFFEVTA